MRSHLDIFFATSPVLRKKKNRENNIWRLERKQSHGEVRMYNCILSGKFITSQ